MSNIEESVNRADIADSDVIIENPTYRACNILCGMKICIYLLRPFCSWTDLTIIPHCKLSLPSQYPQMNDKFSQCAFIFRRITDKNLY
jgi:hypothetical protein